jgi:hypothetical protein
MEACKAQNPPQKQYRKTLGDAQGTGFKSLLELKVEGGQQHQDGG